MKLDVEWIDGFVGCCIGEYFEGCGEVVWVYDFVDGVLWCFRFVEVKEVCIEIVCSCVFIVGL